MSLSIFGIPCQLHNPHTRRIVARVLEQIKERDPKDFARIQRRVRLIKTIPARLMTLDKGGAWIPDKRAWVTNPRTPGMDAFREWSHLAPGPVRGIVIVPEVGRVLPVLEKVTQRTLTALAAHELGHACTLKKDIKERKAPNYDLASEAAANFYAFKWGFGEMVRKIFKSIPTATGFLPGIVIEQEEKPGEKWLMDPDFVYRKLPKKPIAKKA